MWNTETIWFDVSMVTSLVLVGTILFGHFEEHKPKWRRLLKVGIVLTLIITLSSLGFRWIGFSLIGMVGVAVVVIHGWWLPKHGINGWTGEPKDKYYELIGVTNPNRDRNEQTESN